MRENDGLYVVERNGERAQGYPLYYREERRVASEERDVGFYSEDREATQTGGIQPN